MKKPVFLHHTTVILQLQNVECFIVQVLESVDKLECRIKIYLLDYFLSSHSPYRMLMTKS